MFRHTEGKKPSNSGRCLAYCAIDNGAEQDGRHEAKDEETEETSTMFVGSVRKCRRVEKLTAGQSLRRDGMQG